MESIFFINNTEDYQLAFPVFILFLITSALLIRNKLVTNKLIFTGFMLCYICFHIRIPYLMAFLPCNTDGFTFLGFRFGWVNLDKIQFFTIVTFYGAIYQVALLFIVLSKCFYFLIIQIIPFTFDSVLGFAIRYIR